MSHTTLSFAGTRTAPTIPDLLRADQPKRRILRQPLGVVHIFVSRQPTVDGLSQQIGEWYLDVLAPPVAGEVLGEERTQHRAFIQPTHQQQAAVGSNPRSLEIDLQRGIEGELKGLVFLLTHWVEASAEFVFLSTPHGYWRWFDHTAT